MDEMIAWNDATNQVPSARSAREMVEITGDSIPHGLEDMFLQYLAADPDGMEQDILAVEYGKKWKGIGGLFEQKLLLMWAKKLRGEKQHLVFPSVKSRCHFHIQRNPAL